jgi:cobalt/nickel transport system ATP-binding protein
MLFKTENLTHIYSDGTIALDEVTFSFDKAERIALLGTNGSGKTTLLNHLNGILKPTTGRVLFDDKPLKYDAKSLLELRRRVGFVFQDPNDQLFAPTVKQDVAFGPLNLGYSSEKVKTVVDESLKIVRMSECSEKPPHFLSLGQKKLVALAGVLAMEPEVIILDEPTSNLDPRATSEILHLLFRINREKGITLLLATHDVDMVPLLATKMYVLNKGKLVCQGTPRESFSNGELIRKVNLRSPRLTNLFEVLKKEDKLPIDDQLPLTIRESRKAILRLLKGKAVDRSGNNLKENEPTET